MNIVTVKFPKLEIFEVVVNASALTTDYGYFLPAINYTQQTIDFSDNVEGHSPIDSEDVVLGAVERLVYDNASSFIGSNNMNFINPWVGQSKQGLVAGNIFICTSSAVRTNP